MAWDASNSEKTFIKAFDDMIIDAAYEAYEDAGIEPKDIQAAWLGQLWAGDTGQLLAAPLKLGYIPITHTENACATGSKALRGACYAVASGVCDIALALGVEKLKDTGFTGLGLFDCCPVSDSDRRQSGYGENIPCGSNLY